MDLEKVKKDAERLTLKRLKEIEEEEKANSREAKAQEAEVVEKKK